MKKSHTRSCGLFCCPKCKNKLNRTSNRLTYCVIFIVYKKFTNLAAGRKFEAHILGLKYKMLRATDDMIYKKIQDYEFSRVCSD